MASSNPCNPTISNSNCTTNCSPGCSYYDLYLNYCPLACTPECFSYCNSTLFCAPGCSYYDLYGGQCALCPGHCLSLCNLTVLCTPSCTEVQCSQRCSVLCCKPVASFNSQESISWLIPLIIISALFLCIVFTVIFCRIRKIDPIHPALNRLRQSGHNESSNLMETIHLLPSKYQKTAAIEICTIDLAELQEGELVIFTPCFHIFHAECIKQWIEANIREKACPNCKFNLMGYGF